MEWTEIVTAALTAAATIAGVCISNSRTNTLLAYRLDQLEKKVDEHNGYAKKFGNIEKSIALIEQKMEVQR